MDYTLQITNEVARLAADFGNELRMRGFKTGGNTGQMPVKNSSDPFDWDWTTVTLPTLEEVDRITFDLTPASSTFVKGEFKWNADEDCVSYGVDGGDIAIGKETFDYFTNVSGNDMVPGNIVSVVSVTGNRRAVDITDVTDPVSALSCIGMVTQGASNNQKVRVTLIGAVHQLDTAGLTEGPLYVNPGGGWTSTPPAPPNFLICIGHVEVAANSVGVVNVHPVIYPRVQDLSDVNGTPLTTSGQFLVWNNSTQVFDATRNVSEFALLEGANSYSATATFTYHATAKTAHRNALGLGVGDTVEFDQLVLAAGGTAAGSAPLKLTTQVAGLTVVEQGTFELIGNSLQFSQLVKRSGVVMSQNTRVTTTTLENTVTESGDLVVAEHDANYLEVGKMEEIVLHGTLEQRSAVGATLAFHIKYAGSTVHTISTTATNAIAAGSPFILRVLATVRSVGATGTMQINSWLECVNEVAKGGSSLVSIDTTTAQNTTVTAQWGEAHASNILKVEQGRVLCIETNK